VARETGPADCDVTGPAADLYLMLWNRRGASGLDVRGDAGTLAAFREHFRVTWR
jgi:MDMPI C-terminal domain